MKIGEILRTPVVPAFDPPVRIDYWSDEPLLAAEIARFVITPQAASGLVEFLTAFTKGIDRRFPNILFWVGGSPNVGKSYWAKIAALLVANPTVGTISARDHFLAKLPSCLPQRNDIPCSLARLSACDTRVLACDIGETFALRTGQLPRLLRGRFRESFGYDLPPVAPSPATRDLDDWGVLACELREDRVRQERGAGLPRRLLIVLDHADRWTARDPARWGQLPAMVKALSDFGAGRLGAMLVSGTDPVLGPAGHNKPKFLLNCPLILTQANVAWVAQDRLLQKTPEGFEALGVIWQRNPYLGDQPASATTDIAAETNGRPVRCNQDLFCRSYPFSPLALEILFMTIAESSEQSPTTCADNFVAAINGVLHDGTESLEHQPVGFLATADHIYRVLKDQHRTRPELQVQVNRVEQLTTRKDVRSRQVAAALAICHGLPSFRPTLDQLGPLMLEKCDDNLKDQENLTRLAIETMKRIGVIRAVAGEYEIMPTDWHAFDREVDRELAQLAGSNIPAAVAELLPPRLLALPEANISGRRLTANIRIAASAGNCGSHARLTLLLPGAIVALDAVLAESRQDTSRRDLFIVAHTPDDFKQDLYRFLATRDVVQRWQGDPSLSPNNLRIAIYRQAHDVANLHRHLQRQIQGGVMRGQAVFQGKVISLSETPWRRDMPPSVVAALVGDDRIAYEEDGATAGNRCAWESLETRETPGPELAPILTADPTNAAIWRSPPLIASVPFADDVVRAADSAIPVPPPSLSEPTASSPPAATTPRSTHIEHTTDLKSSATREFDWRAMREFDGNDERMRDVPISNPRFGGEDIDVDGVDFEEIDTSLSRFRARQSEGAAALLRAIDMGLREVDKRVQDRQRDLEAADQECGSSDPGDEDRTTAEDSRRAARAALDEALRWQRRVNDAAEEARRASGPVRTVLEETLPRGNHFIRESARLVSAYHAVLVDPGNERHGSNDGGSGTPDLGGYPPPASGPPTLQSLTEYPLPKKFVWVPLEQIAREADPGVRGPGDFVKVDYETIRAGFQILKEMVLPELHRSLGRADSEHFARLDQEAGLDYEHGWQRVYDAFLGQTDYIYLTRNRDQTQFEVQNGRHRIKVASDLGWRAIPARARDSTAI